MHVQHVHVAVHICSRSGHFRTTALSRDPTLCIEVIFILPIFSHSVHPVSFLGFVLRVVLTSVAASRAIVKGDRLLSHDSANPCVDSSVSNSCCFARFNTKLDIIDTPSSGGECFQVQAQDLCETPHTELEDPLQAWKPSVEPLTFSRLKSANVEACRLLELISLPCRGVIDESICL